MVRILSRTQTDAIVALPGPKRYQHFIKVVADWEVVWGLYKDGWALASTEDGEKVFPVWPAKEYADMCAGGEWEGYEVKSFPVDELMTELVPSLKNNGVLIGVFYTPSDNGVVPDMEQFIEDINAELDKY
jgi:hypothetical protein